MQLLIDSDLVAFRCAASVEPHGEETIALARCDRLMQELIATTESESYQSFLTGANNFRKLVNPQYKANRKDSIPPRFLQQCREFLITEWNSVVSDGCEADDLLGINQTKDTRIASLDKDLKMVPGFHYNWLHQVFDYVTPLDGLRHLYKQMLIGDRADNIFGVDGLGKVKSARLIDPLDTEEEMIDLVFNLYGQDVERFFMNAQCLWILQEEGVTWAHRVGNLYLPDPLRQEVDRQLSSMKYSMVDTSTEPTMSSQKMSGMFVVGELMESMEIETVALI